MTPLSSRHDPSVEREPPPLPTPIIFPQHEKIKGLSQPSNTKPSHSLRQRLAQLKKPSDAKIDLFNALNICLVSIKHPVEFFPLFEYHLPPSYWLKLPDDDVFTVPDPRLVSSADRVTENPQTRTLGTGRPYPSQEVFITRLKEICLNNADAFGALSRTPPPKGGPVRLAHFRRFWEGLDSMAYYWDTSLDEYIFPIEEQESPATNSTADNDFDSAVLNDDEPRKRMKSTLRPSPAGTHVPNVASYNEIDEVTIMLKKTCDQQETNSSLRNCRYKGHRTGNGANMPDSYRLNTVKAFIEPIAWCFGCNLSAHRRPLLLAVDRLMVPVKLSCAIWRAPVDRSQARAGYLEGPVMGIQCREQINFCRDGPQVQDEASLDLLAEASALLMLAEERAREKKSEKKPGEGKWWTEVPRWGGGVGGEIGDSIGSSDEPTDLKYENTSASYPKAIASASAASSHHKLLIRRKALASRSWKKLSPGSGYWDPKVIYKQVGKEDRSSQDEVRRFHLILFWN